MRGLRSTKIPQIINTILSLKKLNKVELLILQPIFSNNFFYEILKVSLIATFFIKTVYRQFLLI